MTDWAAHSRRCSEEFAIKREELELKRRCLEVLRGSYTTMRDLKEKAYKAGKIPDKQRLPVSLAPTILLWIRGGVISFAPQPCFRFPSRYFWSRSVLMWSSGRFRS